MNAPVYIYLTKIKLFSLVLATVVLVFIYNYNLRAKSKTESHTESLDYEEIQTKCKYGERGPRILCAIFIHQSFHKTKVQPIQDTWAKRLLLFD